MFRHRCHKYTFVSIDICIMKKQTSTFLFQKYGAICIDGYLSYTLRKIVVKTEEGKVYMLKSFSQ